ncbi:threonine-phosphate decarboxylase [Pseudoroseomonas rhizosphaerae]|uniref:threonine-phosphate decarboxylase n=1 Tax=Teichococcus rhizosphaerae TaxID=1335062 RepID=A0A2C7AB02_9PROT|nr:threonine-phosphate decarboxylase CobD [Pseudoroseomonas rhizosphaerae]PHK94264.1 threonine-phosphate decarboxylase [Pseudoroseomonas rhizosphaerae]
MVADGLEHGGRLGAARRRFPGAPEPFLDLSTGINPIPWPVPPLPPTAFARLPEPEEEAALRAAAATAYGAVSPEMVAAVPGTQLLIQLLPRLFPRPALRVLSPTYAEHAACWRAAGTAVEEVAEFGALEGAGDRGGAALLCNPNNPDGRRFPPGALRALAERMAARGGLLVVDEAFAELEPDMPGLAGLLPHPALILLRSFGKSHGLAGLRLGFALAAPERAAAIRAALGPWAVSGPAIAIGRAALADAAWREAAALRLARDAARLDALLEGAGLRVLGGTRLFRLAEGDAAHWHDRLGRAGILVRRFSARPRWLRFGLPGDEAAWARLSNALI